MGTKTKNILKRTVKELSAWQKHIITGQKTGNKEIPHPAAAPISTDQEAGDSVTTPSGQRPYDENQKVKEIRSGHEEK